MFDTNEVFTPGKLAILCDGSAGSSGKGVIESFVCEYADNWQFCCNTFSANAGHWVKLDSGEQYFYQTLNSCAYQDKYEKMYIGPGATMELPALWREIEINNINENRLGINPMVSIVQDIDQAFERGEIDFDGNPTNHEGTMKTGSTCHGIGACRARRILRRPNTLLARDIPKLKPFLCDTTEEIMNRLDSGQAGMMSVAQGFQLSYLLNEFYPYTTSRNVTVAAALDDMMLPPIYAGNVLLNYRTYPIRINSKKFIDGDGKHLTWHEKEEYDKEKKFYKVYEGNSGPGYDDQQEINWKELTEMSGSPDPIIEMTSVTKMPRRVFTFSKKNLRQSILYNKTSSKTFISINFANYVDYNMFGKRAIYDMTDKFNGWLDEYMRPICKDTGAILRYVGTGPLTDDKIIINN